MMPQVQDSQWLQLRPTSVFERLARELIGRIFGRLDSIDSTGSGIVDGSITTPKLADAAVTTAKVADDAITSAKLATDSVTSDAIAAGAVGASEIADASVGVAELAAAVAGDGLTGGAGSALAVNVGAGLEISSDAVRIAAAAAGAGLTGGAGSALAVGAGSFVTVNADDVAVSAGGQALWQGAPTFNVGAEVGNVIRVTVQLKDAAGSNLALATVARVWISDAAKGAPSAIPPTTVAIGTAGAVLATHTAAAHLVVISNGSGYFDLDITYAVGAATWYLNLEWGGFVYASTAITFA